MKIWLNETQVRRAIEHFKPEISAEVFSGDVYLDTETNQIVFMGVNYPVSYSLGKGDYEVNCDDEPLRLQVIVQICDCHNYGRITIIDNIGNGHGGLKYDIWDDNAEEVTKEYLSSKGIRYHDITFHYL